MAENGKRSAGAIGLGAFIGGFIGLGLGAVGGIGLAWQGHGASPEAPGPGFTPVLVAAEDIAAGTEIEFPMLSRREYPDSLTGGWMLGPDDALRAIGMKTAVPLEAGEPLLWSSFVPGLKRDQIGDAIDRRTRAFRIELPDDRPTAIWPDHEIDVLATLPHPETKRPVTTTLVQRVPVLATGWMGPDAPRNLIRPADRRFDAIWVQVLPREAELLATAQAVGTLTVVLRNPGDLEVPPRARPVVAEDLLDRGLLQALGRRRAQLVAPSRPDRRP